MARPNQDAIETFISITGLSEAIAVQKLEEHGGNLNEAINAHFSEGDRNLSSSTHSTVAALPQDDYMDIDNEIYTEVSRPLSHLSSARNNPFSLLDPTIGKNLLDTQLDSTSHAPFVTHPREVREIPIEAKDGSQSASQASHTPTIEDVTGSVHARGPDVRGNVRINDEDDDTSPAQYEHKPNILVDSSFDQSATRATPSAPKFENLGDYSNDIEEEMVRAAIEASKQEVDEKYPNHNPGIQTGSHETGPRSTESDLEDPELAHAVSLSLKTAEQEKALHLTGGDVGAPKVGPSKSSEVELRKMTSNGRLQTGSSSSLDEGEELEEQPLVRNRPRRIPSGFTESVKNADVIGTSMPPITGQQDDVNIPQHNGNSFPSDEWGGISSEEHDEAVMLEAAMFGGIPEGSGYRYAYASHEFMRSRDLFPRPTPRPPSPSLAAQRLIREQQDDEYLASLQADREKELKAIEEAEAAREEEKQREEESCRKLQEEQELETQLAAKEASLPSEPSSDDENAVTLLVRMPDGSRRGRRFLRSDNLQSLFDFIDVGRVVKPGSYRLVRPYPRRAFSYEESASILEELGLTNKQEALFLELI